MWLMSGSLTNALAAIGLALAGVSSAWAIPPYAEQFPTGNANWSYDNANTQPAAWVPNGGPNSSSHIVRDFSAFMLSAATDQVLFRAMNINNSSNDNFFGNWLADGINEFSMWVRHDAGIPLQFFGRFVSAPVGGAGVAALELVPVATDTWTRITFEISLANLNSPGNPTGELVAEGFPPATVYNNTFSNVNQVQVGFRVPTGFGAIDDSFTYRLDRPAINVVPEPATLVFAGMSAIFGLFGRRRRAASN
jgi:hypothetical protein